MPWSVEGGDELGRPGRRRCVVGHGGERSGWRLKEVPTCGSRLAAAEREGKKVGRQEGEIGRNWRWACGLLGYGLKKKRGKVAWAEREAAVWDKRGESLREKV
jgi:hypothetical protein